jgi:hypothetical protein
LREILTVIHQLADLPYVKKAGGRRLGPYNATPFSWEIFKQLWKSSQSLEVETKPILLYATPLVFPVTTLFHP